MTDVSGAAIGCENYHLWGGPGAGANVLLGRDFMIFARASLRTAAQDVGKSYGWKGNEFRWAFEQQAGARLTARAFQLCSWRHRWKRLLSASRWMARWSNRLYSVSISN
ncbi:hypothetical protein [Novosphingobium terrae]|uniref:hypothetical protein n=1 Tax=Novosphingobium terrae TaxID=2726189 RepID=UPI001980B95F|nr:hypothetical protein [Novosphingobium terrae]